MAAAAAVLLAGPAARQALRRSGLGGARGRSVTARSVGWGGLGALGGSSGSGGAGGAEGVRWMGSWRPASNHLEVLEFTMDGGFTETTIQKSSLGLPTRDLDLFSTSTFAAPQSTISPRNGSIVVRMEDIRAIVMSDRTYVVSKGLRPAIKERLAGGLQARFDSSSQHNDADPDAYELRALDVLMAEQCHKFETKLRLLESVAGQIVEEVSAEMSSRNINAMGYQRIVPLKKAMTALEADVTETHDAIVAVMNDPEELEGLQLTARSGSEGEGSTGGEGTHHNSYHHYEVEAEGLLQTYRRQLRSIGSELREIRNNLDSTEEVWRMQMDNARNRILQINLYATAASLGFTGAAVPCGLFGMNLTHGFEEHALMFWWVTAAVASISTVIVASVIRLYHGDANSTRAVQKDRALKDLVVHHFDDVEYILSRAQAREESMNPTRFHALISEAIPRRRFGEAEVTALYRMFDTNGDGHLNLREWQDKVSRRDESEL